VVDATGKRLKVLQAIDLPGPRLPHDMAFTERFVILNDLPVFWDADLLARGIHAVRLHEGLPSRFAILPREGGEPRGSRRHPPMSCTG
jgi:carotenoid cleavage dioxygenase-like enzyme